MTLFEQNIIVRLKGGLGNQMFQLAAAYAFSLKRRRPLKIDNSFLIENNKESKYFTPRKYELDIFYGLDFEIIKSPENKCNTNSVFINERNFYKSFFLKNIFFSTYFIDDYFQSENYFKDYLVDILKIFKFKEENLSLDHLLILKNILELNSISIHVRRGDYVKPEINKFHGLCSIEYYRNAINRVSNLYENPIFFIFSDDFEWVKSELIQYIPKYFLVDLTNNSSGWMDMCLMSRCKANIIANSTFSWWGAYLNLNPDKTVVAPKQWFLDPRNLGITKSIIPESWIKL